MVEKVESYKASDGTLYSTERMALHREAYLALQKAELGNHFQAVYDTLIHGQSRRQALFTAVEFAKEAMK